MISNKSLRIEISIHEMLWIAVAVIVASILGELIDYILFGSTALLLFIDMIFNLWNRKGGVWLKLVLKNLDENENKGIGDK